jgi:catechol 2,3-dioxygenase-like lactoylglutathione lyase family enzyme
MLSHLDHLVITTRDKDGCVDFYSRILGMNVETFGNGRIALRFGAQKLNVHEFGHEFLPKASHPTPGSLDLCFLLAVPLEEAIGKLTRMGIAIEEGPVQRTGAQWPIRSVYVRDPDMNLIELSERL